MPLGRTVAVWYLFSVQKYDLSGLRAQSGLHQHHHILELPLVAPARPLHRPVGRKGGATVTESPFLKSHPTRTEKELL